MGNFDTRKTLTPVMGTHGCLGPHLSTAKGWKAYDADDNPAELAQTPPPQQPKFTVIDGDRGA